jgi:uncharacterized membrane protein
MAYAGAPPRGESRAELTRLELFSDAVFAIAITLLVLELKVPEHEAVAAAGGLGATLMREIPKFYAFFISFAVIGNYWILHHRMFHELRRSDEGLVGINLALLLFVAFLPFPVALFGTYRRDPVAIGWYVAAVALTGLAVNALWIYARKRRLVALDLDRRIADYVQFRAAAIPIVFAISLPFAFLVPMWTTISMVVMFPLLRFFGGRFQAAAKAAEVERAAMRAASAGATPATAPTAAGAPPPPTA